MTPATHTDHGDPGYEPDPDEEVWVACNAHQNLSTYHPVECSRVAVMKNPRAVEFHKIDGHVELCDWCAADLENGAGGETA